ncbi:RING-box protein 2 isoform X1 [Coturnix japonica]|uniref:RING-box protein 2 isoform X1 n=1 Tax=Coturnix japonica TaxID=93934 RepID=UPI0013A5C740|nr:RING-box protein 2 isoform X1 [Coturnix japonica]
MAAVPPRGWLCPPALPALPGTARHCVGPRGVRPRVAVLLRHHNVPARYRGRSHQAPFSLRAAPHAPLAEACPARRAAAIQLRSMYRKMPALDVKLKTNKKIVLWFGENAIIPSTIAACRCG